MRGRCETTTNLGCRAGAALPLVALAIGSCSETDATGATHAGDGGSAGAAGDASVSEAPDASAHSDAGASGPQVWTPWPMWAHDPQQTSRSPFVGPHAAGESRALPVAGAEALAIAEDGALIIGAASGRVVKLERSGEIAWTYTFLTPGDRAPTVAITPDGTIIAAGQYGPLTALTPDGGVRWELSAGHTFATGEDSSAFRAPVPAPDGSVYATEHETLYRVDVDGNLLWRHSSDLNTSLFPPSLGHDGTAYTRAPGGGLLALSPDGEPRFSSPDGHDAPTVADDGSLHFGGVALAADGGLLWSRDADAGTVSIGSDGNVYSPEDRHLRALSPTGQLLWSFDGGGTARPCKPIVDRDGTVYTSSTQSRLYAVGPDGRARWSVGSVVPCPVAIDADGTLYYFSEGNLHALGGGGPCEGSPARCDDGDPCTVDRCDETSGCAHEPRCEPFDACQIAECAPDGACLSSAAADGTPCSGAADCRSAGVCQAGVCTVVTHTCGLDPGGWPADGHDAERGRRSNGVGPSTGTVVWRLPDTGAALVDRDGSVFARASTGLVEISPDGTVARVLPDVTNLWALRADGLLIGRDFDELIGSSADGSSSLTFRATDAIERPTLGPDGTLYFGTQDRRLHAVRPDFTPLWELGMAGGTAPPVVAPDGTIYVASENLYAISPSGHILWMHAGSFDLDAIVLGPDQTVYVSSRYHADIHAISATGELKWTAPIGRPIATTGAGDVVFIGDGVVGVVVPDGTTRWTFPRPDAIEDLVVDAASTVFVATNYTETGTFVPDITPSLHAIASNGELLWSVALAPEQSAGIGALALGTGGRLYATLGGALVAIE